MLLFQPKKNVVPNKFFCSWRSFPAEQYKQDIHYLVHCRTNRDRDFQFSLSSLNMCQPGLANIKQWLNYGLGMTVIWTPHPSPACISDYSSDFLLSPNEYTELQLMLSCHAIAEHVKTKPPQCRVKQFDRRLWTPPMCWYISIRKMLDTDAASTVSKINAVQWCSPSWWRGRGGEWLFKGCVSRPKFGLRLCGGR